MAKEIDNRGKKAKGGVDTSFITSPTGYLNISAGIMIGTGTDANMGLSMFGSDIRMVGTDGEVSGTMSASNIGLSGIINLFDLWKTVNANSGEW